MVSKSKAFVENQVHADLKELSESKRKLFQYVNIIIEWDRSAKLYIIF